MFAFMESGCASNINGGSSFAKLPKWIVLSNRPGLGSPAGVAGHGKTRSDAPHVTTAPPPPEREAPLDAWYFCSHEKGQKAPNGLDHRTHRLRLVCLLLFGCCCDRDGRGPALQAAHRRQILNHKRTHRTQRNPISAGQLLPRIPKRMNRSTQRQQRGKALNRTALFSNCTCDRTGFNKAP